MTDQAYSRPDARTMPRSPTGPVETGPAWSGKLVFGGVLMVVAGLFNLIIGLVALIDKGYYVVGPSGLLVLNLTGWGWLHVVLGALVAITGGALFTGATWARVVTVLLAGFNALASLLFIPAYPVWSLIVIALDVVVIWAVITADAEPEA